MNRLNAFHIPPFTSSFSDYATKMLASIFNANENVAQLRCMRQCKWHIPSNLCAPPQTPDTTPPGLLHQNPSRLPLALSIQILTSPRINQQHRPQRTRRCPLSHVTTPFARSRSTSNNTPRRNATMAQWMRTFLLATPTAPVNVENVLSHATLQSARVRLNPH